MDNSETNLQNLKRHLIFHYGSLVTSSKKVGIRYYRLVNILSGRTEALPEEIQRIEQVFCNPHLDAENEVSR